ncbi:MAG: DNA/RNA nuclease SfsA [Hyphomicrobiales bacterium]|nr:DNA/RNA nuclease SfsA [Hyphomicrobiales bacterium]
MRFPTPLIQGALVQRYKRFLADVRLAGSEVVTAHCPNPGAMLGMTAPGLRVWLSVSTAKGRALPHTLEIVETLDPAPALVGVNTGRPNSLVEEAIRGGVIAELGGYEALRREVKYGGASRIDMLLTGAGRPDCYVEVKNVHLVREPGLAEFPDCVTARGAKHLRELAAMVAAGKRAVMVYCVQRGDAHRFRLAADIDPQYAAAFAEARRGGVEALCYACEVAADAITLNTPISINEPA